MKTYSRESFNFNDFSVYAYTYENSHSWGHIATLFYKGRELATNKIRYYNRTWECYTYQTIILSLIRQAIEDRQTIIFNNYKYEHNLSRLKQSIKDDLTNHDAMIQELQKCFEYFSERG